MFMGGFLATCGVACGIPLLFIAASLSRRYVPNNSKHDEYQERSISLMADRNQLDQHKVDALRELCKAATER